MERRETEREGKSQKLLEATWVHNKHDTLCIQEQTIAHTDQSRYEQYGRLRFRWENEQTDTDHQHRWQEIEKSLFYTFLVLVNAN